MGLEFKEAILIDGGVVEATISRFVWNENHSAEIDGIKVLYETVNSFLTGMIKVIYNGQVLTLGVDYLEASATEIELQFTPIVGDTLIFDYIKAV